MKCPKCSFTNLDYVDLCSKCNYSLTEVRALLGLMSVKPRHVSFLSHLIQPTESKKGISSEVPETTISLEGEISLDSTEPEEESLQTSPFDLSQIDLSDLEEEAAPETNPPRTEAKRKAAPAEDADMELPEIDLSDLDSEPSRTGEPKPAKGSSTAPAEEEVINLDELLETEKKTIQSEETEGVEDSKKSEEKTASHKGKNDG